MNRTPSADQLAQRGLKLSHLRLLAALADTGQISLAAERIGVAQPAASRLLAEVERIVGQPVHQRTGRGMALTAVGQALATRAQRIQMELRDAARDMAEVANGGSGHVRIGSVTSPTINQVLPALRNARLTAPQVTVEVIVATSDILGAHLLEGRIDFAIGRLPDSISPDLLSFTPIAAEPVSLVVRKGHPLASHPNPTATDLLAYDWVMPPPEALLSRAVLARLRAHGMATPPQRISTASFLLTFALVQQSNAIAPLARAVVTSFSASPNAPYAELAIDLGIEVEPFGLMTRADAILPPVAARLAKEIQAM